MRGRRAQRRRGERGQTIPLIAITGVTGVFFRALAVTMSVSLLTSLALAVTWTPTLSQYFIRGKHGKKEDGLRQGRLQLADGATDDQDGGGSLRGRQRLGIDETGHPTAIADIER